MKNLLTAILIIGFLNVSGQEKKTTFGFKGGLNKSKINGFQPDGTKIWYSGTELYGSLFSDTELKNRWNVQNELLFSWTDMYHFIEVPVHVKYNLYKQISVFTGPKLDFIIENDDSFVPQYFRFKKMGISAEIGAQYKLNRRFFAETRYARSFTEQVDDLFLEIYQGKRNTFRVGLGVNF